MRDNPIVIRRSGPDVHKLTHAEQCDLGQANKMLAEITESHATFCTCELCAARMLTSVGCDEFYSVPFVTFDVSGENEAKEAPVPQGREGKVAE